MKNTEFRRNNTRTDKESIIGIIALECGQEVNTA